MGFGSSRDISRAEAEQGWHVWAGLGRVLYGPSVIDFCLEILVETKVLSVPSVIDFA